MYNPSDIYVSGGPDVLRTCWTDTVSKFDTSSFYVWEQDNLPLHDLDERDALLWGKLGHPASSMTGMSFVVSADATSACEPTYFTTLSSCIDALPEVITCPILVEVASFGALGPLHLSNKSFGPRGSLEIVNRNVGANAGTESSNYAINIQGNDADGTYGFFASSIEANGPAYEVDTRSGNPFTNLALAPHNVCDLVDAKMYSTDGFLASANGYDDMRFSSAPCTTFVRNTDVKNNRMTAAIRTSSNYAGNVTPWDPANGIERKQIVFEPYELNSSNRTAEQMDEYDVSTLNEITGSDIIWGEDTAEPATGTAANTYYGAANVTYVNHLSEIKIDNCKGPIYIRQFFVDGDAGHDRDVGISITDSELFLDKCAASRFRRAGLHSVNSKVKLRGGFVAYRNYGFDEDGNRLSGPYANKRTGQPTAQKFYGVGIKAENSTIEIVDNYTKEYQRNFEAFSFFPRGPVWTAYTGNGAPYTTNGQISVPSQNALFCLSRNDIGIELINSTFNGGKNELETYDYEIGEASSTLSRPWLDSYQIFSELNTEAGIVSKGSVIDYSGRLFLYGNHRGLDAHDSDVKVDVLKAQYNQREGIRLCDSNFIYGKDGYQSNIHVGAGTTYADVRNVYDQDQITLKENGKHLHATNSTIKTVSVSSVPLTYQSIFASGSIGVGVGRTNTKVEPAIHLDNSFAELVHPTVIRDNITDATQPSYGDAILANNNSTVFVRGSSAYATRIIGPETLAAQARKAGITANNNSTVYLQGPTVISRFAVAGLADNNSKIEISPHRDTNGELLASAFDLNSTANHTMVEAQASRAVLVADHGSVLKMEDAGSYHAYWSGTYASAISITDYDYLKQSEEGVPQYVDYVSGGYIQLLANGDAPTAANPAFTVTNNAFTADAQHPAGRSLGATFSGYLFDHSADEYEMSAVTTGGMAVRALNSSKVEVNNVHFPTGWPNTSAVAYDFSGLNNDAACSRIHIWNIADNSILNAKYITVSGAHPRDAGYYGPSGTWGASQAPISTPDTSSLSVLDYYGRDSNGENRYGKSDFENFGAFRLFFSTDPVANYLVDPTTIASGLPYQIFSQGYHCSAPLSAPGSVSSQYTTVLMDEGGGSLVPSGFYYASAMMTSPRTVKAVLDDSASNTFANAKHNSVNKSGLPYVVNIYNAYDEVFGGDSVTSKDTGTGLGSVNNFDLKKDN